MHNWHELYILVKNSGQKLFRNTVSPMGLVGAIREIERHYNNIKKESVGYGFTDIDVVIMLNGNVHISASELSEITDDELIQELLK